MCKKVRILLTVAFGGFLIGALLIKSASGSVSYLGFHRKDEVYYANLAMACDSLFACAKNGR